MSYNNEFMAYVGNFVGSKLKNQGEKNGKQWACYDINFHHGDPSRPVRFTLFNNVQDSNGDELVVGQPYRVVYVMEHFKLGDGTPAKSKKVVKVYKTTTNESQGFQDNNNTQQQTQGQPQSTGGQGFEDKRNHNTGEILATPEEDNFIKRYLDSVQLANVNNVHFIGSFAYNMRKDLSYNYIKRLYELADAYIFKPDSYKREKQQATQKSNVEV